MHVRNFSVLVFLVINLLSSVSASTSVELSPTFVRMPFNESQVFEISLTGEGKVYEIKAYGSNLDWSSKDVWVGSYGKKEYITFTPDAAGDYSITVELNNTRDSASILVYEPDSSNLWDEIVEARGKVVSLEEEALLNEVERLFNESRFELAEIRLDELVAGLSNQVTQEDGSSLPQMLLIFLLLIAAVVMAKLVF
ncbi:MAG: hypothetical protein GOV00_01830 [Candidatus Altiarchaeota archaeon]|nr:hypothetical protein [Candidatus Altiarchaeota archaeon]